MKLNEATWQELAKLQSGIVACPNQALCRSECKMLVRDEAPIPDYIGVDYSGLVIIATNPGSKKAGQSSTGDLARQRLADALVKKPSPHRLKELSEALDHIMLDWQSTITNQKWRTALRLPVKKTAAINLIKCRTTSPCNDPFKISPTVAKRCFETHTQPLLGLLNPTHLIGQWKGAAEALARLWPQRYADPPPSFNGQRDLPDARKPSDILPVIAAFNQSNS
jgi:hypothetical protein